jgi:hypothetical protein
MKHSVDELLETVYRHYPRGVPNGVPEEAPAGEPRYEETEEYLRLVAARRRAGADYEPWRALLRRLRDKFPECGVQDRAFHLPSGGFDASYSAWLRLPTSAPGEYEHSLGFLVSILVPYYVVYSTRTVDDPETTEALRSSQRDAVDIYIGDTMFVLPAGVVTPELKAEAEKQARERPPHVRRNLSLELSADEQPYAAWIAQDIEATFGDTPMPPEVGKVIVPDVMTGCRSFGEATLYDCLLSDQW